MSIIAINSDYSNIADFVNSLFSAGVRTITPINNAIQNNQFFAPFSNQGDKITSVLLAAWQSSQGDSYNATDFAHCPDLDQPIIAYLANFIKNNELEMSIPQISFVENTSNGPAYQLNSYQSVSFFNGDNSWNYNTVNQFLELLIYGAHFVCIHASEDLPNGSSVTDLWTDFQNDNSLKDQERADAIKVAGIKTVGNSHYTSATNTNGYYYLNINEDTAPNPCSFILSFLVCPTVARYSGPSKDEAYNTFFQLEGWQLPTSSTKAIHSWHSADFDLYNECYWNISTYGASVYSEKRGTAIFLAPSSWIPKPNANTIMPPFAGATSLQSWLDTSLVSV